jgi:hypothetical protein
MRSVLRTLAILIGIAGVVDPEIVRRSTDPPAVEITVPSPAHPDHARSLDLKERMVAELDGLARFDDVHAPSARLAIGPVRAQAETSVPLFALSRPPAPVAIVSVETPDTVVAGQQIEVVARVRGYQLAGRVSQFHLRLDGVTIATASHTWNGTDETHPVTFVIPGQREGTRRLQVAVVTGRESVTADTVVTVTARALRVFAYEPRPSWPVTFARRILETDPRFDISAAARSSSRVATTTGEGAIGLPMARLDTFDVLLVGGLDALGAADVRAIVAFVEHRGGTLILLPDGRVPEAFRARMQVPRLQEVLLTDAVSIGRGGLMLKASEFLLPAGRFSAPAIAELRRDGNTHPVVFAYPLGNGTVVFSGALDAWRYRTDEGQDLDAFVRSLVAEAALIAPPPVDLSVSPSMVRPGEPIAVRVAVRPTAFVQTGGRLETPPVSGAISDSRGRREMIRLWPTSRIGELAGVVTPPREGRYAISVSVGSERTDAVLLVEPDVTRAHEEADPAAIASLTGGAVVGQTSDLRGHLASLGGTPIERRMHPMRSPWWIAPFAAFLAAEWASRRRAGLR